METGLVLCAADASIKILKDPNLPGFERIIFTGERYNPLSWCLSSKIGELNGRKF
jgi:hypothetical protein